MIALLKYGSGVPFYRLEGLEASLGIPLPASTQWEIVEEIAAVIRPAFDELIREAAQAEVFYNDDTSMKILALARASPQRAEEQEASDSKERTGLFTSGIVSMRQGQRIALFFTGRQHAGENFAQVLAHRAKGLAPPIQMCDALSRNLPKLPEKLEILLGNCNAHARRRFVQVTPNFPQECQFVLESLREVYRYDGEAEALDLSGGETALSSGAQRARDGRSACLVQGPVRRKESGAQLGSGRSDLVLSEAVGSADPLPSPGRRALGLVHRRAGSEEMHSSSKEQSVL